MSRVKRTWMQAGAGKADITPALGIQIAGDIGRYRPAEEIRERLYARALVLESSGRRVCVLSLELTLVTVDWSAEIRRRVAERLDIAPGAVMLHCLQLHAAPQIGHDLLTKGCPHVPPDAPWMGGGDDRYNEPAIAGIMSAVDQARQAMRPVKVFAGRGTDGRVAFNRRFIMRDGSGRTHPPICDPNILCREGPMDPEVGVLSFVDRGGRTVAAMLHHTCHPCHDFGFRRIIADWPGWWSKLTEEKHGDPCVALVVNGCCGNIHHTDALNPDYTADHRRMAGMLVQTADKAFGLMEELPSAAVSWKRTVVRLPMRMLAKSELAAARKLLREHPEPMWIDKDRTRIQWDWVYAAATLDLHRQQARKATVDYEVQAFNIAGCAVVALMGEPFVEAQLEMKLKSPARFTFVAHLCNGYVGYLPTAEAFARGGYETRTANWSRFGPGALEKVTVRSLRLLRQLF